WPAPTICATSSGDRTVSRPLAGTIAEPPSGCSWFRHGDLNSDTNSTPWGDQMRVSAEVPSTAPPTPSEVATVMYAASPVLTSAVTKTPDLSFGTASRITTDDNTQRGSSISV